MTLNFFGRKPSGNMREEEKKMAPLFTICERYEIKNKANN